MKESFTNSLVKTPRKTKNDKFSKKQAKVLKINNERLS